MANSRAARLAPVVEMAESAERTAAQRLGHFQGQVRLAESKLGTWNAFVANTSSSGSSEAAAGFPANG